MHTACGAGLFSTATAATSNATCLPCTAGSYVSTVGQSACVSCAAGTYGTGIGFPSASSCTSGSGLYSSALGSTSVAMCLTCGTGAYTAVRLEHSCCLTGTSACDTWQSTNEDSAYLAANALDWNPLTFTHMLGSGSGDSNAR